jgi:hypothetical protein
MLENSTHATIAEIAAAEKINESYVGRVLRFTLLAPELAASLSLLKIISERSDDAIPTESAS